MDEKKDDYWKGQVDARLEHFERAIKERGLEIDDYRRWREKTSEKLTNGNKHFEAIDLRLQNLELLVKSHVENKDIHQSLKNGSSKYLSWPWIIDKIIVPVVVWSIILLFSYLLVNRISLP